MKKTKKKIIKMPEDFISLDIPYGPIYGHKSIFDDEEDSFSKRELNKPGTLIFTEKGETFLLGHINCLRGVCDDCTEFNKETIILGYKVIWKE